MRDIKYQMFISNKHFISKMNLDTENLKKLLSRPVSQQKLSTCGSINKTGMQLYKLQECTSHLRFQKFFSNKVNLLWKKKSSNKQRFALFKQENQNWLLRCTSKIAKWVKLLELLKNMLLIWSTNLPINEVIKVSVNQVIWLNRPSSGKVNKNGLRQLILILTSMTKLSLISKNWKDTG